MTKTVKEIEQIQDIIDFICFKHQTNVDDKLIKLYEIRNKILYYENELAEKDKQLEIMNEQCDGAIRKILEQQLYKEDFKISDFCINCGAGLFYTEYYQKIKKGRKINLPTKKCSYCGSDRIIKLKDNSLYDKLPSKEEK